MRAITALLLFILLVFLPVKVFAKDFGVIFDVQGEAWIENPQGKSRLDLKQDLMRPLKEKDTVSTGKGKVLVVSLKESKGYEIGYYSAATVKSGSLNATRGQVKEKKGQGPPLAIPKGRTGGFTLRYTSLSIHLKIPDGTVLLENPPVLSWESLNQNQSFKVTVTDSDGRKVFEAESRRCSVMLKDKLETDKTYLWQVSSDGVESPKGSFSIPDVETIKAMKREISFYKTGINDGGLPVRLSLISYLMNNNLNIYAEEEINALEKEFPDNVFILRLIGKH
jgi:hypothetical protein